MTFSFYDASQDSRDDYIVGEHDGFRAALKRFKRTTRTPRQIAEAEAKKIPSDEKWDLEAYIAGWIDGFNLQRDGVRNGDAMVWLRDQWVNPKNGRQV